MEVHRRGSTIPIDWKWSPKSDLHQHVFIFCLLTSRQVIWLEKLPQGRLSWCQSKFSDWGYVTHCTEQWELMFIGSDMQYKQLHELDLLDITKCLKVYGNKLTSTFLTEGSGATSGNSGSSWYPPALRLIIWDKEPTWKPWRSETKASIWNWTFFNFKIKERAYFWK